MKLDAIGIIASDMKKSITFYEMLGLNFDVCENTEDHIEAKLESGLRIMIDSEKLMKELDPDWKKPEGQRMTLAFVCESPKAVDELYTKIENAGYKGKTKPWDAFWGQRYASVLDPDGNAVDLFAAL